MPSFFILFVVKISVVWSKQLQLLRFAFGGALFFAGENFHIAELFVGDAQYSHFAVWGQHIFHAFYVHVSHFCCDLLSNFVSLTSKSNSVSSLILSNIVVICFQILYL